MNTSRKRRPSSQSQNPVEAQHACHFEEMPDPRDVVEHLTIPGFIRRAPHKFHLDEITRFGDKIARVAESLQVSYLTTIDTSLGVIRLFPVPLLVRVYQVMATQFHWQPWTEPLMIDDRGPAERLRNNEKVKKHLQAATGGADMPPDVAAAMLTAINWLEADAARLRGEVEGGGAPTPPPPLRAL